MRVDDIEAFFSGPDDEASAKIGEHGERLELAVESPWRTRISRIADGNTVP
jgi:hypothetical protein